MRGMPPSIGCWEINIGYIGGVESLNKLLDEMCANANISREMVLDSVVVSNTIMQHLFVGLPLEQLGHAPFAPAMNRSLNIPACKLGLNLSPGAKIYLLPVIAGHIRHVELTSQAAFTSLFINHLCFEI
jgi:uncharacterized 2Fe-2S/4Fe-4S cluster protein (DUF4445 family)